MNMSLLGPITRENIYELKPGEWIWDNKSVSRKEHVATICPRFIEEPMGFRQIHILDLKYFGTYSTKPFMLSNFHNGHGYYTWEYFEEGRYFRFKKVDNSV